MSPLFSLPRGAWQPGKPSGLGSARRWRGERRAQKVRTGRGERKGWMGTETETAGGREVVGGEDGCRGECQGGAGSLPLPLLSLSLSPSPPLSLLLPPSTRRRRAVRRCGPSRAAGRGILKQIKKDASRRGGGEGGLPARVDSPHFHNTDTG